MKFIQWKFSLAKIVMNSFKDLDFFIGVWLRGEFLVCKIVEIMTLIKSSCLYYERTFFPFSESHFDHVYPGPLSPNVGVL